MTPYGYIYITTNTVNGKKYIGQNSYSARVTDRYLGSGKYLKAAVQKYGRSHFQKEIIFEAFSSEDLNWAEKHFILFFGAVKSRMFYNVSPGGKASLGFTGRSQSDEFKEKMSLRFKHQERTSADKATMSKGWIDRKAKNFPKRILTPIQLETIRKNGMSNKGKKRTIEQKELMSLHRQGKPSRKSKYLIQLQSGVIIDPPCISSWCKSNGIKQLQQTGAVNRKTGAKLIHREPT